MTVCGGGASAVQDANAATKISGESRARALSRQGASTAPWYQDTMRRFGPSLTWGLALMLGACSSKTGNTVAATPAAATVNVAPPEPPPEASPESVAQAEAPKPGPEQAAEDTVSDPRTKAPEQGWLGVELEPPATGEAGVRIARVVPHSPADQAGLAAGDLIERLDGESVSAPEDVVGIVGSHAAGSRIGVALKRLHTDRLISVTLSARASRDEVLRMGFVGEPAPPLDGLHLAKGSLVPTLGAQRGHVVLIEFWAPFCMPCRALIPHLNQLHAQYAARGLSILGVTLAPVTRAAAAATDLGMEYPIASDESERTSRAYQASATPMVFLLDRGGTVREVIVGYDAPRLAKLDQLVDRLIAER
jgi:thiol-disulfide isomerase/thioredoxin